MKLFIVHNDLDRSLKITGKVNRLLRFFILELENYDTLILDRKLK